MTNLERARKALDKTTNPIINWLKDTGNFVMTSLLLAVLIIVGTLIGYLTQNPVVATVSEVQTATPTIPLPTKTATSTPTSTPEPTPEPTQQATESEPSIPEDLGYDDPLVLGVYIFVAGLGIGLLMVVFFRTNPKKS